MAGNPGTIGVTQLGHMRPTGPAAFMVFDHSETEEDTPVSGPTQSAKVLGDELAAAAFTLKAMIFVWHGMGVAIPLVTIP